MGRPSCVERLPPVALRRGVSDAFLRPLLRGSFLRFLATAEITHPPRRGEFRRDPGSEEHRLASLGRQRGVAAARAMVDGMPHRDDDVDAAMVAIHLRSRDLPRAEALFCAAPPLARGLHLDTLMLGGYVKSGHLDRARRLFDGMAVKSVVAWTCMVSGYCSAGLVDEARRLFDLMPCRNVFAWTTMVQGYARNGMLREAREMFDQMPERNVVAWTVMVKAYADNGCIQEAGELFSRMPRKNTYSWHAMITGFMFAGKVDDAIELFDKMPHRNVVSWTIVVTGLAHNGFACKAREFFDRTPKKDTPAWNAMITAYTKDGHLNEARRLFDRMPAKDLLTWNIIINGYSINELKDEALRFFLLMLRSAVSPDSATLISILLTSESTMEVRQIHGLSTRLGFQSETNLGNTLVTMYSRSGDLSSSWLAFRGLNVKDAITWTSTIQALANHGCAPCALQGFAQMLRYGYKPSSTTFTAVLSACTHVGLVEKGQKIFKSIHHVYGLEPTIEHYSCLVDLLGRGGYVREAKEVVDSMEQDMCDEAILGILLGACMTHNEVEIAREVAESLVKIDPSGSGGYTLLANVFASGGMWNDMASVWKIIKASKVKKTPGFSQIEVNARNHVFYSRDQMHSQCTEIYEMLNCSLVPQMKGSSSLGTGSTDQNIYYIV
ncbi:pentatricopeptide repeat-containing protein At2g35030, mitochondrial-like [Oryza brachyantha]|uniref:Pentatricopeptide repeat-containing protein n=1 Tax=Oryza brachyantha TaxID=4533 RepID=J3M3B8_ORYBR|nr:pentatricopeptide repeat-containing protein At2g35030, mitochondrial-like [Oryza brachyantha]